MTQSLTIITGEEIIKNLSPKFWEEFDRLVENGTIKIDGALDDIPNPQKKTIIKRNAFRFIVEVQRIDNIQESNILKNLKEIGGYRHKSAGVADAFEYEDPEIEYVTSPDGLHRWIMAYLCNVLNISVNLQDVHAADATNEEIIAAEKQFFDDKNGRNAKITLTDQMRSDKLSNTMTPKQQKLDEELAKAGINVGDIGAPKETATYSYGSVSELDKLVTTETHPCYTDTEEIKDTTIWMKDFIKNDALGPRLHGGIVSAKRIIDSKGDAAFSSMFEKWLRSTGKYSYAYYQTDWWTAKVQHTRNMENTTLRLLVAFNQWYRDRLESGNCISLNDVEDFLKVMNTETNQFVDDCIVKEMLIDYAPVAHATEEEDSNYSSIDEALNV